MAEVPTTRAHPVLLLEFPAFQVTYPKVRNIELIDRGVLSAMEESWARKVFHPRKVELFHLRDVFAINESLFLDRDLRVIENVSDQYSAEEYESAAEAIKQALERGRLPHLSGLSAVARRRAAGNYGHFLIEMLPMALIAHKIYQGKIDRFLLHRSEAPMLDVNLRAFRLAGISPDRLWITGFNEPLFCHELITVRGLTEHGKYMSPLAPEQTAVIGRSVWHSSARRLFVRRVPGWKRGRELDNEQEIADRLERQGYRVIDPGSLPLDEQIAMFGGADHVVGVMGAGMTNIVFCRPGTRVTMLTPANFPDVFFWFIASHRRLNYEEVRGIQPSVEGRNLWEGPFSIAEADIRWVEQMNPGPPSPFEPPYNSFPPVSLPQVRYDISLPRVWGTVA